MPLDPVIAIDTRSWLRKSALDLRCAEADLAASPPLFEDVLFHCQQAAEKAIKSFLMFHQRPFGKTHNLRELSTSCLEIDPTLAPILERAFPLTIYAWKFRYPVDHEEPTTREVEDAWTIAREVFGSFLERLPNEVHP